MKNAIKKTVFVICVSLITLSVHNVRAQFMPVVYDNTYGKNIQFAAASADFENGDFVWAGYQNGNVTLTWVSRTGEALFTKRFSNDELALINNIIPINSSKVLLVGSCSTSAKGAPVSAGRAIVISSGGTIDHSVRVGDDGTSITWGSLLGNGNMILSGSTINGGRRAAIIAKISPRGKLIYNYIGGVGESCDWFDVLGSRTEYLNAAFSYSDKQGSSIVRLDENGKPYFITTIPDPTFKIQAMQSTLDGDIYLVGQGKQVGGALIKIRQEGDIVFCKQIIPNTEGVNFDKLIICPSSDILVGGNDSRNAYYALLRSDGTELALMVDNGTVGAICQNPLSGDCMISLYDSLTGRGKIVKLSKNGSTLYQKNTAAKYTSLRTNVNGDLLMASPESGRLSMLSQLGELLFDRYVTENNPTPFSAAYLPMNGEAVFVSNQARVAKLAHGVYLSDITVNKPISGNTTAVFTVTLSGYAFNPSGAPLPVSVNYNTKPISATEGVNYDPVAGTLSFIPSTDGSDRYLNKFTVEVPVNANDMLEGNRTFALDLSDVSHSYLIRSTAAATIKDQPAVVKMVRTSDGIEGERDVTYELGIFKTNGTPLTNATNADIVIDGTYGKGTADKLDFDMGRLPRLVIAKDKHSGVFNVVTLDNTRYESTKTVVIDFNKVYSMSDTDVSFPSSILSCVGMLHDQAAVVVIESLGDHIKFNNTLSGLFKISLLRAKDGVLLTNNSGSDIILTPVVSTNSTAKEGTDFVLSNSHDLRIWGDDKSSAVNLTGMVLFTDQSGQKIVSVSLENVKAGLNAGPISIDPNRKSAQFTIVNK